MEQLQREEILRRAGSTPEQDAAAEKRMDQLTVKARKWWETN